MTLQPTEPESPVSELRDVLESPPAYKSLPPRPFGIGGLLAFFMFLKVTQPVFIFTALGQFQDYPDLIALFPPKFSGPIVDLHHASMVCILIGAIFSYITGIIIASGSKKGRRIANWLLLTDIILFSIPFFLVPGLPPQLRDAINQNSSMVVFAAIVLTLFWFLYLNVSKRCRNTYDTEFKIKPARSCIWSGYVLLQGFLLAFAIFMCALAMGNVSAAARKAAGASAAAELSVQTPQRRDRPASSPPATPPAPSARVAPPKAPKSGSKPAPNPPPAAKAPPAPAPEPAPPPEKAEPPKPKRDGIRTIPVGGTEVDIPIPDGYVLVVDTPMDLGPLKQHFIYRLNYPEQGIQCFISAATFPELDSVRINQDQFAAAKLGIENGGSTFDETRDSIIVYNEERVDDDATPLQVYSTKAGIYVKSVILLTEFVAIAERPDNELPQWVKQSASFWRDAILAANR